MVESGNQDGHGLNMVHADIKLVLQHSSPLITHTGKSFFPLVSALRVHITEDPKRGKSPTKDPTKQDPLPPPFPDGFGAYAVVVVVVDLEDLFPPFEAHLGQKTITKC